MTQLFLIARVAGHGIAVDAAEVESVVTIAHVIATPRVSSSVRGLAALRSRVVTVIDPTTILGGSLPDEGCFAIVTSVDGHGYAVLVEEIRDVVPCERQPLTPGLSLDARWSACIDGMVDRDGHPVPIIRLGSLLPGIALAA